MTIPEFLEKLSSLQGATCDDCGKLVSEHPLEDCPEWRD